MHIEYKLANNLYCSYWSNCHIKLIRKIIYIGLLIYPQDLRITFPDEQKNKMGATPFSLFTKNQIMTQKKIK